MTRARKLTLAAAALSAVAAALWAHWPAEVLPLEARADRVVVKKSARELQLLRAGTVLKTYSVSLGGQPVGPKRQEGDQRTPEGEFLLDWRNPQSSYHLSLHVSYPTAADVERARRDGVSPGGEIMVHGLPNGMGWIGRWHRLRDWTAGCVAVTNPEIREIWRAVPDGTPITILP